MRPKPKTFSLVDEPKPFYQNFSRVPEIPAAKLMRGDDGMLYEQGFDYVFEEGWFKFFNGQMWPMELVREVAETNLGRREVDTWKVIPHDDPVANAAEGGSITLIYEPPAYAD